MQTATRTSGASQAETTQPGQLVERAAAKYLTANLGPLPSDFAPPTDCGSLSVVYLESTSSTTYVTLGWGAECDNHGNNAKWRIKSSCYPPRYGTAWQALKSATADDLAIYPLFSPASICPTGFYPACSFVPASTGVEKRAITMTTTIATTITLTRDMTKIINNVLDPTQSAVGCCPTGFSCFNDRPYVCFASATTSVAYAWFNGCPAPPAKAKWVDLGGPSREVWSSAALLLLVQDNTQSQANTGPSVPVSSTASGGGAAPRPDGGAGDGGGGGGSQVSAATDNDNGGLSTGAKAAKAAIGASVPLAAIVIGLALFFFFFRRRSRRRDESSDAADAAAVQPAVQPADSPAKEAAALADYDPRQSDKFSQPVSALTSPVPDRAQTVSPDVNMGHVSELYGSVAKPVRLHEDIMELPGEVVNPPGARGPVSEAP